LAETKKKSETKAYSLHGNHLDNTCIIGENHN